MAQSPRRRKWAARCSTLCGKVVRLPVAGPLRHSRGMQQSTSPQIGPMWMAEAEHRLLELLNKQGDVSIGRQAGPLLDALAEFALYPAEDTAPAGEDGGGLLAQFGTYDLRGAREFQVDLTRQFIEPREDGEIWQLHCTLFWPATSETDALGSDNLWSFGMGGPVLRASAQAAGLGLGPSGQSNRSRLRGVLRAGLSRQLHTSEGRQLSARPTRRVASAPRAA